MSEDASARKKQYVATAIVVAAVVSGISILIALTQQKEEGVVIDTNPLLQSPGSQVPSSPAPEPPQQEQRAASITLSPSTTAAESRIAVQGTGFAPNERVTVAVETTTLETAPPAVAADQAGNFAAAATVPDLPPGQYEVVAIGESGSAAAESMTIS